MRLKHHRFRFGLIGNLKVLLCRIFGHRVSDDPTGFACQRCRLAYEEIYSPGYWANMLEWFGSDDRDDDVEISMPILDGSEMIGEETVDEYLDRLVKEASPSWQGVDPEKFLDEVRGRVPFDEAISLLRQLADLQNGPPLQKYREEWEAVMSDVHEFLHEHETGTDE